MKNIDKITKVIAKILEISHWVAVGLMAMVGFSALINPNWLKFFIDVDSIRENTEISVYGFEVLMSNSSGGINMTTLFLFSIGAVIIFALIAMIFRNIYLIVKKSENNSPFQSDNIRMLKEIGIFSILIPVISLIMSIIIRLIIGVDFIEISVDTSGIIMGIIVLCLTQYFAHGAEIEKDIDGLL